MLGWWIVVTVSMMLALLPAFMGLLIVLPILGHATWRLYERAIVPAGEAPGAAVAAS